jgi:hypothetical protein
LEQEISGKDAIAFTALFPHDTQQATLALAQRYLRAAFARLAPESALPFGFMPPFCPAVDGDDRHADSKGPSRLAVGPATVDSGWIVAPVSCPLESDGEPRGVSAGERASRPTIPGYPALPPSAAFILGFAGPLAKAVLALAIELEREEGIAERDGSLTAPLSVRARYRARVELSIARDERAYSVAYSVGPASWAR